MRKGDEAGGDEGGGRGTVEARGRSLVSVSLDHASFNVAVSGGIGGGVFVARPRQALKQLASGIGNCRARST